jgi:NAD(P)-dependent dehydrogenase (short-subunit alcohol dehydrogenase family)
VTVDVSAHDQIAEMVTSAVRAFGRIDALVSSAGIHQTKFWLDLTEEDWDATMAVNLRGLFFCAQAVARQMIVQGSGRMVHIASAAGKRGGPYAAHYAASKAGVISVTRAMALGLAPHRINVNCVCPGDVDTPMSQQTKLERAALGLAPPADPRTQIPLGRATTPEELAGLVAFLCSDEAAYMTGQALNFTGGSEMR